MKYIFIFCLFFSSLVHNGHTYEAKLDQSLIKSKLVNFIPHIGEGPWDNYLVMNLPFVPIADIFKQLLIKEKRQLTSRGEAHLTVITPIEFWEVLKPTGISMDEINSIALAAKLQGMRFKALCVGSGAAILEANVEKTFYLVVESSEVIEMRKAIEVLFLSRGGEKGKFDPLNYHPHITIGFTKRDLHFSDGVVKDKNSCIYGLR